jgi:hypothetical protein
MLKVEPKKDSLKIFNSKKVGVKVVKSLSFQNE